MALLVAVEARAACRSTGLGTHKIDVGTTVGLKPFPKDGAPTARGVSDGIAKGHDLDGGRTDLDRRNEGQGKSE